MTWISPKQKEMIRSKIRIFSFRWFVRLQVVWLLSLFGMGVQAQGFISGYVRDKESGEPLIGASIFIPGTTAGVSSGTSGFYVLKLTSPDTITLAISYIGYQPDYATIVKGRDSHKDFYLKKGLELDEIKVKAPLLSGNRFGSNVTEIPTSELKNLPSLGGETDLIRAYQFLPGVHGGTEGKAGMYVRGGSNDQNLVLLDGFPLYYINHLGGFTSLFDPEAVKNFRLYKGGFPARYGNRLSSVLDVSLIEGDKFTRRNTLSIGLLSGSFSSQGPAFQGKGSYFISLRRMWADFLTRPATFLAFDKSSLGYNFYDFNTKITYQSNPSNRWFISLYRGDDNLVLDYRDRIIKPRFKSAQRNRWGNFLTAARWEHTFSPRVVANTRLSFTRYRFLDRDDYRNSNTRSGYENSFKSRIRDWGLNSDLDIFISNQWQIKAGVGVLLHFFEPGNTKAKNYADGLIFTDKEFANTTNVKESSFYIENPVSFQRINFNAGIRLASFVLPGKRYFFLEPRFSSSLDIFRNIRLKFSFADMHQLVHMFENQVAGFGTEFFFPSTDLIPPSFSRIVTLGLEKETGEWQAGIDFYQKRLENLSGLKEGESFQGNALDWQSRVEKGTGTAKGMELFIRRKQGNLTGWVSYTIAIANRQFTEINNGKAFPYQYDRRHDLSLVVSYRLTEEWRFSVDWVYGSGYPITLALGKQNILTPGGYPGNLSNLFGTYRYGEYYGTKNGFRMRDYHRLDIGFTHTRSRYGKERIWSFSIYNVYNRQNPYYYFYKERKPWRGDCTTVLNEISFLPILPAISYTLKF